VNALRCIIKIWRGRNIMEESKIIKKLIKEKGLSHSPD
jgi:hypothetical protein